MPKSYMEVVPAAHFRECGGRVFRHRWIRPKAGGFGCPVNPRFHVYRGLHTHRFRGANFIMREAGHTRTVRAEKHMLHAKKKRVH